MKINRLFAIALSVMMMVCFTDIKSIAYANSIAVPTPVISGINTSYRLGDNVSINLTSTGVSKLVQYKAVLTNQETNESVDLINGYTSKYYNPQYKYSLKFQPKSAGKYKLVVTSKLGGYKEKYSKSVTREFTVISDAMIIDKIDDVSVKTNINEGFAFPSKVTATMKDGSKKEYDVTWNSKDFKNDVTGQQIFYGTVKEYTGNVKLTVNVVDEKIISIDPITVSINEGDEYVLPNNITCNLNSGKMQSSVKWNASSINTDKPGTYKYEGIVSGFDGKAELTLVIKPVKLSLNSIVVSNLKEIKLNFSKKLDISTVNKENIRLFKGTSPIAVDVNLDKDNKTAILSISAVNSGMENMGRYTLVVENIKDLSGSVIENIIKDITAEDTKNPEVLGASAAGPYNILLEFSEPIKNTSGTTVEIKAGNRVITASPIVTGFETNNINIGLSSVMTENTTYDISIKGFTDFAGHQMAAKTISFTYKKNTDPISVKVEKVDPAYVALLFNKTVRGLTKDNFYYGDISKKALAIYSDIKMTKPVLPTQSLNQVWVKFYDSDTKTGTPIEDVERNLGILSAANGYEIVDPWGNSFKNTDIAIAALWDREEPKVYDLRVNTESSLILEFNEGVKLGKSNIEITDKNGEIINASIVPESNSKYVIDLGRDYSGYVITLTLKDVEDMAFIPNKLLSYKTSLAIIDKTPPVVSGIVKRFVTGLDNSLYISFNEDVNDTALNIGNYYIQNPSNNIMVQLTEKPVYYDGRRIIRIPLTSEEKALINSGYNIFVSNIQDLYNNNLAGQLIVNSNIISFDSKDNRPNITRLEVISKNQLKITFNQYLRTIDKDAFLLNGKLPKELISGINNEGNSIVTLVTDDSVPFTSGLGGASLILLADSTKRIENIFGLGILNASYTSTTYPIKLEDRMGPGVKVVSGIPQVKAIRGINGIIDGIVIEYEENIDMSRLSALSYSVKGRDIAKVYTSIYPNKGIAVTGNYVIIELKPVSNNQAAYSRAEITQVLDIYDLQGNKSSPDGVVYETLN